jgi:F5/8 type C domain-containing protein/zinc ribbon protein
MPPGASGTVPAGTNGAVLPRPPGASGAVPAGVSETVPAGVNADEVRPGQPNVAALVVPISGTQQELPPQAEAPKAPVLTRAAPTRKVRPGEKVCAECGEGNQPTRKFCSRCGHSLADAVVVRVPWWRRIFRRRGPKVLGAGKRPGNVAVSGVGRRVLTFARRGFWVVLLVFSLLAGFYPPLRTTVTDWFQAAKDKMTNAAEQTFDPVRPVSVKASAETKGHPGKAAVDQFTNTYWAAPWDRDHGPVLTLDLGKPTTVVKLIVTSGAKNEFAAKHRPSIVVLSYSNEKSDTVLVRDTPEPQEFTLPGGIGASQVRIQVLDVYPAEGATEVALTELELFAIG